MDKKETTTPSTSTGLLLPLSGMSLHTALSSFDIESGDIEDILPKAFGNKNERDLKKIVKTRLGDLKDAEDKAKFHGILSEENFDVIRFVEDIIPLDWSEMAKGPLQDDAIEYAHFEKKVSVAELLGDFDETDGGNWGRVCSLLNSEKDLKDKDAVTVAQYGILYVTSGSCGIDQGIREGTMAANIYARFKGRSLDVSSLSGDMATAIGAISNQDNVTYLATLRSMWSRAGGSDTVMTT